VIIVWGDVYGGKRAKISKQKSTYRFFESGEKPVEFVISDTVQVGSGTMELQTKKKLQLPMSFLDASQGEITRRGKDWYYRNFSITSKTYIKQEYLSSGEEIKLSNNDLIRITVCDKDGVEHSVIAVFSTSALKAHWKVISMEDPHQTIRLCGGHDDQIFAAESADLEAFNSSAVVIWKNGHLYVTDIGTPHGIKVNGDLVDMIARLNPGDALTIGGTIFLVGNKELIYNTFSAFNNELNIHIESRTIWDQMKRQVLLRDINLSIDPGNMVLVLGGSGAGKTTFVNAITGYEKAHANITSGGLDVYNNYDKMRYKIGFVPQQDLLRGDDSVQMTLTNAAAMRMPANIPADERREHVDKVLKMFGLEATKKELVSKLSGGQRKRLSICVEYIADPSLFILDEPDSGLDGVMARDLMESLRLIANEGKVVLVISHTPDRIIGLFDKVIVLAKDSREHAGQLAFYGNISDAKTFFGKNNMEDIVLAVNSREEGGEGRADYFIDKYKELQKEQPDRKSNDKKTDHVIQQRKGRLGQVKIYLGKLLRIFVHERDWKVILLALLIAFVVAFVVGSSFFKNMEGTLNGALAIICVCIWNGFFNSIQTICRERAIIKREHRSGMHISAYIAANMIYQLMLCVVQVFITIVVFIACGVQFPTYGPVTGSFMIDISITLFLITYASDMLALMVSCFVHTTTTAMTVMPFLLIVELLFSGAAFTLDDSTKAISNLTVSKWGINAVCSEADYNSLPSVTVRAALWKFNTVPAVKDVIDYLNQDPDFKKDIDYGSAEYLRVEDYECTAESVGKDWIILIAFAAIYACLGTIALEFIDRDKR
jgi:ABC-type multidrug transport system ATPase subunit